MPTNSSIGFVRLPDTTNLNSRASTDLASIFASNRDLRAFGASSDHLKPSYGRMVLVSVSRHLSDVDIDDTDTLIVTHSWLMWQQLSARGSHCVHYEFLAPGRRRPVDDETFIRINDWLFDTGGDPTIFRGVSLARLFAKEMQVLILESKRLLMAIEELVDRFGPSSIVFHDFRADHSVLDISARYRLVAEAARRRNIAVDDRRDPPLGDDPELPFSEWFGRHERPEADQPSMVRRLAVRAFSHAFGWLGHSLRRLNKSRPAVLLAATHLVALPLLNAFKRGNSFALVLSDWYPRKKDARFLLSNLGKGILPISLERAELDAGDKDILQRIVAHLEQSWRASGEDHVALCRQYFMEYVVATKRFGDMAAEIKTIELTLRRSEPDIVFTDGVDYYLCVLMLAVAKRLGIATVATWHAPFVQDIKLALVGCDPRLPPIAEHFFSWSSVNDRWLENIGASVTVTRTGNPVSRRSSANRTNVRGDKPRILLLQYAGTGEDYIFPQAMQYEFFVEMVRSLKSDFDADIRLKIHPGPYSSPYYRAVADWFNLDVAVFKNEPFSELLAWADVVIGPAASGAMMEVAGTGKPYLPILLQPSLVNRDYFRNIKLFDKASDVSKAIMDTTYTQPHEIEAEFSGNASTEDSPASTMWVALDDICARRAKGAVAQ